MRTDKNELNKYRTYVNEVLGDIKEEILEQYFGDSREEYFSDNDSKEYRDGAIEAADYIIKMIDKYKAESEE